jgi:hypothetical protein
VKRIAEFRVIDEIQTYAESESGKLYLLTEDEIRMIEIRIDPYSPPVRKAVAEREIYRFLQWPNRVSGS